MLSGKRTKSAATESSPDTPIPKRPVGECNITQTPIYRPPVPPKPKHLSPHKLFEMDDSSKNVNVIEDIKPAFTSDTPVWAKQIWTLVKQTATQVSNMHESLKVSFTQLESKIEEVTQKAEKAEDTAKKCKEQVDLLKVENEKLMLKLRTAEAYSKKNNLIFLNIPESEDERPGELLKKLGDVLKLMDIDLNKICIDNIHRLPGPKNKPKPLIVKFVSFLDRNWVLINQKKLKKKNSNVIIKVHLPVEVENEVKQLLPIRRAAIDQGFNVKLINEKGIIVVNGQSYRVNNLHTLPVSLRPENVAVRKIEDYLFFFTGMCPLSNFSAGKFKVDGECFENGEQFIQSRKAKLFKDQKSYKLIMEARTPQEMHYLGKNIQNYSEPEWREKAHDITLKGLEQKFSQNQEAKDYLMNTGSKRLVEASASDSWWGIGVHLYDKDIMKKKDEWGSNMLGSILMTIRQRLTAEKPLQGGETGTLV